MNTIMNSIKENIAYNSNIWKHLLSFSGGAQNITKCVAYIIEWYYTKKGLLKMINDNDTDTPTYNTNEKIKRNNNDEPFKYLGITTSPNGDQLHPINTLKQICSDFVYSLYRAPINERDAEVALRFKLLPKIQYQIIAYSITRNQYKQITKIYESDTISKMGYNKHWPHELRYDSFHSGLALPQLYLEQVIQHITAIYGLYTNKETHALIMNALQLFQIQIGTSGNIFQTPQAIHHGSSTWIKQWVNELSDFKLSIHIPLTLNLLPQRKNDQTLMDVIKK